ncbi:MAG TPA: hypothetical protein DCS67_07835 [Clostridiales bacterium UBA8960]|jgi:hypothetical protein|nr:hypothetical protein [Clostridiales bacterium UBA8960]
MIEISKEDTIYELVTKHPEIKTVLYELGFVDIVKPGMLQTAGRVMTLAKGSAMKKIPMNVIAEKMNAIGFDLKEA